MLTNLIRRAHWLDGWLHEHVGRPYIAILGGGPVLFHPRQLELAPPHAVRHGPWPRRHDQAARRAGVPSRVADQSLAQWHDRRERRRDRAKARS
ncbi:MAG: hypothetical protein WDN69_02200 [Aliidongia sp.]